PQQYQALNAEQEVYWLPFGANKVVEFSLGGGGFAGYGRQQSFTRAGIDFETQRFYYLPQNERGLHAGYLASATLDFALSASRTWRLGTKVSVQNDTRGTVLPGGQVQLSRAW
ncbi:hypothetical protein, partial [Hymenobacter persicinus]